jgi:hypothetical protein
MEVDKASGSKGTGSKGIQTSAVPEIKADSRQAIERGTGLRVYINEHGETCVGAGCLEIAVNPGREEVVVKINRNECGQDLEPVVNQILDVIGKGGVTVYESHSTVKKST